MNDRLFETTNFLDGLETNLGTTFFKSDRKSTKKNKKKDTPSTDSNSQKGMSPSPDGGPTIMQQHKIKKKKLDGPIKPFEI